MDDLCEIIASIIEEKIKTGKAPEHAMLNEIATRYKNGHLRQELDALEALGLLVSGNTINSKYYILNQPIN